MAESKSKGQTNGATKLLSFVIGIVLTFVFIKYDWAPPKIFDILNVFKEVPTELLAGASFKNPDCSLDELQRAIAAKLALNTKNYRKLDKQLKPDEQYYLTKLITNYIRNEIILNDISALRNSAKHCEKTKNYEAIEGNIEPRSGNLEQRQLATIRDELRKNALLLHHLKGKYNTDSIDEIARSFLDEYGKPWPGLEK